MKPANSTLHFRKSIKFPVIATVIVSAIILFASSFQKASAARAMLFLNGAAGTIAELTPTAIAGYQASGFGTLVIFNLRVDANGNFQYGSSANYPFVCSNGVYAGDPAWPGLLGQCKASPSSVNRIEMCIGGSGDPSFTNIKNRIASDGTGSGTILYRNLQALKNGLGMDAVDYDDEQTYDSSSAIKFGLMAGAVGLRVTLCPYTNPGYWQAVQSALGVTCDAIYLQCYSGGAGNSPATWNTYFSNGMTVTPGYWDNERTSIFLTYMMSWSNAPVYGGFLWPTCSGCNPPANPGECLQYAGWIHQALDQTIAGAHRIVDIQSNDAIDNGSFTLGSGCEQWAINNNNNGRQQRWIFTQNSDTSWCLTNQYTALAMEMEQTTNLAQPKVWTFNNGSNQRWWVDWQSDGTFKIWNQWSSLAIENASATNNGTPIIQWNWDGQVQQRWSLQQ